MSSGRAEAAAEKTKRAAPSKARPWPSSGAARGCQRLFIRQNWIAGARLRSHCWASTGAGREEGGRVCRETVIELSSPQCPFYSQACAQPQGTKPPDSQGRPLSPLSPAGPPQPEQLQPYRGAHGFAPFASPAVPVPPRFSILQQQPVKSGMTGAVNLSLRRPSFRACIVLFPNRLLITIFRW